jgi:hypothetical protein
MFRVSRGLWNASRPEALTPKRVEMPSRMRSRVSFAVAVLWQFATESSTAASSRECGAARFRSSRALRDSIARRRSSSRAESGFFSRRQCRAIPGFATEAALADRERDVRARRHAELGIRAGTGGAAARRARRAAALMAGGSAVRRSRPTTTTDERHGTPRDRGAVLASRVARDLQGRAARRRAAASTARMRGGRVSIIAP